MTPTKLFRPATPLNLYFMTLKCCLVCCLTLLSSCSPDVDLDGDASQLSSSAYADLTLSVSKSSGSTRGSLAEKEVDMGSLGLFCAYTGEGLWSSSSDFSKMNNLRYNYADSAWSVAEEQDGEQVHDDSSNFWENRVDNEKYTFHSYSPFATEDNGITATIVGGELSIHYVVPELCANQPDLMIAESLKDIEKPRSRSISLGFSHALAAIEFQVKGDKTKSISAVAIKGLCNSGTLTWDYTYGIPFWDDLLGSDLDLEYTAGIESDVTPDCDTAQSITKDNGYLMMIPQTLPEGGVTLYVTITDCSDNSEVVEYSIPATTWLAGMLYTYTITLNEDSDDNEHSESITITQTANCYILHPGDDSTEFFIPVDSRSNLYWGGMGYNDVPENVISVVDGVALCDGQYPVRAAVIAYSCNNFNTNNLDVEIVTSGFSRSGVSRASLAAHTNDFTDANCNVALKVSLGNYQDGSVVVAVYKQVCDGEGLEIDEDGIVQNGDEILWSWHLWVTDYDPDGIAYANQDKITPNSSKAYYSGGSDAVHRYQDGTELSTYVSTSLWDNDGIYSDKFIMDRHLGATATTQLGHGSSTSINGHVTYQFGRKDPLLSCVTRYVLNSSSLSTTTSWPVTSSAASMEYSINHPTLIVANSSQWCTDASTLSTDALWYDPNTSSDSASENYGKKSLFDPSPIGWCVPLRGVWSNFDNTSTFIWNASDVGRWYPNDDPSGPFAYYPAIAYRSYPYGAYSYTSQGFCWTSEAKSAAYSYDLFFSQTKLYLWVNTNSCYGYQVRPIQE